MKFAIFGQTVSSSWGNGHATLWRGLINALTRHGHEVVFFERDVSYYAENRDLHELCDGARLVLYPNWASIAETARAEVGLSDVAIVTSYCPDGAVASDLVLAQAPELTVYYDLDTPVTLARLNAGETVPYLPAHGLGDFDLVLSYTGGEALKELSRKLGARRTAPLYGHADPAGYRPMSPIEAFLHWDICRRPASAVGKSVHQTRSAQAKYALRARRCMLPARVPVDSEHLFR
jgi:spore maturation protein CgeB